MTSDDLERRTITAAHDAECGWWVGPIWKLDGETCVCGLTPDHDPPHVCDCGTWFEACGHPSTRAEATP